MTQDQHSSFRRLTEMPWIPTHEFPFLNPDPNVCDGQGARAAILGTWVSVGSDIESESSATVQRQAKTHGSNVRVMVQKFKKVLDRNSLPRGSDLSQLSTLDSRPLGL
ncbi:hypothetical protein E4U43_003952 [Claviceps pusilla]|uniref:Uncharacterized protein n=1 Tax=Claviceps pusilla TaxID=123648 RepID=A0A9P7N6J0_9HYPO|nr:hypothetical protein E4U43_003952 [Claviceps pusilla]